MRLQHHRHLHHQHQHRDQVDPLLDLQPTDVSLGTKKKPEGTIDLDFFLLDSIASVASYNDIVAAAGASVNVVAEVHQAEEEEEMTVVSKGRSSLIVYSVFFL